MTRTFTVTEEELEALLAAAEYSKRAEEHVKEIQNCVYMQRVRQPIGETVDRLRKELHAARFTPDPVCVEPLSDQGREFLIKMKEISDECRGIFPFIVCDETTELRMKKYIEPGMQCVFEKWGSEKQYRPTPHEAQMFRFTDKAESYLKLATGGSNESTTAH